MPHPSFYYCASFCVRPPLLRYAPPFNILRIPTRQVPPSAVIARSVAGPRSATFLGNALQYRELT
ncbi:hypothetical protein FA13DRAFT_596081 [Coprinellus micaceus]|uniref:Uncharacterized protein n=1 Tax=Coprinellus micaceus TaxID=71717 RepID=A0A4Y7T8B2_COPMI|nr:hypothetical protein FA13DRAFT_596081 [Coprinellus micaceus]